MLKRQSLAAAEQKTRTDWEVRTGMGQIQLQFFKFKFTPLSKSRTNGEFEGEKTLTNMGAALEKTFLLLAHQRTQRDLLPKLILIHATRCTRLSVYILSKPPSPAVSPSNWQSWAAMDLAEELNRLLNSGPGEICSSEDLNYILGRCTVSIRKNEKLAHISHCRDDILIV